jgi:hypothetical protein
MSFNLGFCQKSLNFHGIPHIISVIHGSHISILTPFIGGEDYYCKKSFHYVVLQKNVDTKCVFWDYEFGLVGSMHYWTNYEFTEVGKMCIQGKFMPYN